MFVMTNFQISATKKRFGPC